MKIGIKVSIDPKDPNLLKDAVGFRPRSGTRYCECCKSYQPHHGTKAVKPWKCFSCKPRLVQR